MTSLLRAARRAAGLLAATLVLAAPALAQTGALAGLVLDGDYAEPLPGANVLVTELGTGAATGLDGTYRVTGLAPGTYTVRYSFVGFDAQTVENVQITAGETTEINITLGIGTLGELTVQADEIIAQNSEIGLLRSRQLASVVSDAISAEAIGRSGASTAGDALGKVTGASVVGGRYVVMRGLQGRYLNVQLNGATIPSSDPDQNTVPLDLFPTGLLDNIVTTKTFSADRPGDFTGGSVNLTTREFPSELTGSLSFSTGFETSAEPGAAMLAIPGARLGLFGTPSQSQDLPAIADDGGVPAVSLARNDAELAQRLDAVSDAFSPSLTPVLRDAPVDQGVSFSLGNQIGLGGTRALGVIAGVNWSRSYDGFSGGTNQTFKGLRTDDGVVLDRTFAAAPDIDGVAGAQAGSENVLLGGLANLSLRLSDRHEVGLNLLANRSTAAEAYQDEGRYFNGLLDEESVRRSRSLLFQERSLGSAQLRGEHGLTAGGLRLDWNAQAAQTSQDEPDYRVFIDDLTPGPDGTLNADINTAAYTSPTRFFRRLDETNLTASLDLTAPVRALGAGAKLKVGGAALARDRAFEERTFQVLQSEGVDYAGDPDAYFSADNAGIVGTDANGRPVFGTYIADATSPQAAYDGSQQVVAGYVLADAPVAARLRAIAGVRLESNQIDVRPTNLDDDALRGELSNLDVLPSLNLVYGLSETVNVRAAYGRTVARPNFRELAPYAAFELRTNRTFTGNADLERTLVDNVDLRAEWFARPGEIVAVSVYAKRFQNPIELTYNVTASNPEIQPRNLENASVFGIELEARRALDFLPGLLSNLQAGGNLTLAASSVDILPGERERRIDPTQASRELQGQSPYVLNVDLGYEGDKTSVSLLYNLFGSRLNFVSVGLTPDVYEQARGTLDLTARRELFGGLAVRASAKNLTNSRYELAQTLNGQDFVTEAYDRGRAFSLGVSYGF